MVVHGDNESGKTGVDYQREVISVQYGESNIFVLCHNLTVEDAMLSPGITSFKIRGDDGSLVTYEKGEM